MLKKAFNKVKESTKKFWNENKKEIIVVVAFGAWTFFVGTFNYKAGLEDGSMDMLNHLIKKNGVLHF